MITTNYDKNFLDAEVINSIPQDNEVKNNLQWKCTTNKNILFIKCDICQNVATGLDIMDFETKKDKFIFNRNILEYCVENEDVLHQVHELINNSSNVFKTLEELSTNSFDVLTVNPLFQQLLEAIMLRFVCLRFNSIKSEISTNEYDMIVRQFTWTGCTYFNYHSSNDYKNKCFTTDLNQIINYYDDPEMIAFSKCVASLQNTSDQFQRYILTRYLMGKVKSMFKYTKDDLKFTVGRTNLAFNYLVAAQKSLIKEFRTSQDVRVQLFELLGKPGIGKSQSLQALTYVLRAIVPMIPMEELVYSRSHDKWWNDYCGQVIVLYDDISHSKKGKIDYIQELISVGSGTFNNVPMAFVKDMLFTSSLVIITSNIPVVTLTSCFETHLALQRRIISSQFEPRFNLGHFDMSGIYHFDQHVLLLNVLRDSNNRIAFGFFSETIELLLQSQTFEFENIEDWGFLVSDEKCVSDDIVLEQVLLTSSVLKSCSVEKGKWYSPSSALSYISEQIITVPEAKKAFWDGYNSAKNSRDISEYSKKNIA